MYDETEKDAHLSAPLVGFAICVGVLLVLGLVAVWSVLSDHTKKNNMNRYVLGEATDCGYIGIRLTYDKEPVDVKISDPYGRTYSVHLDDALYELNENEKTIILLADSDKLGTWSAEFNTKSNKNIQYSMVQTPSETLYIVSPTVYQSENGNYYLKFTATLYDAEETTADCNLTLSKSSFSYGMEKTEISLNQETNLLLSFPDHAFTDENYKLRINLDTDSKTANTEVQIHLNAKPESKKPPSETTDESDE